MFLYVFTDSLTGEIQQPILAHNDGEAIRIAHMAFANVPHRVLHDLYLARVTSYDHDSDPQFSLSPLYCGNEFISEVNSDAEEHDR